MDSAPLSLRDQGTQALREGQLDRAIDLLARAVMADDQDAEAKALLGIAYSQKGLHAQAKRALQTSVELQPQNPNFRFNLGVVLERAGDAAGAAAAYTETLQLKADHAQARAKLQALGPAGRAAAPAPGTPGAGTPQPPRLSGPPTAASAPPPYGAAPPASMPPPYGAPPVGPPPIGGPAPGAPPIGAAPPPSMPPPYGGPPGAPPIGGPPPGPPVGPPPIGGPPLAQPPGVPYGAPPIGPPPIGAPPIGPPPIGGPPIGGPPLAGVPQQGGPPGTIQCGRCAQWTAPGMTCQFCGAPMPPPPRVPTPAPYGAGYGPQPMPPTGPAGYGGSTGMTSGDAFGRRWGAAILDGLLMRGIGFITTLATGAHATPPNPSPEQIGAALGAAAGQIVVAVLYYVGMTAWRGQTLGKMALGIRVVGPDGDVPGFGRAFLRETIGKFLSTIVCLVGYLSMLWDSEQQTWHDKIAGTHVERV